MSDQPTIQALLTDEKLLRLEIAKVLTPGPWEHEYDRDGRCRKCGWLKPVPLSIDESGEGLTDTECPIPKLPIDPMEVLVGRLVKKLFATFNNQTMGSGFRLGNAIEKMVELSGGDEQFSWWLTVTPTVQAVCCLMSDGTEIGGEAMSDQIKRYRGDYFCNRSDLVSEDGEFVLHRDFERILAAERERVKKWIGNIMERRKYAPCWYSGEEDDGDCGNWPTCDPHCSLREMMDFVRIVPQDDGGLDKQPSAAVEPMRKEKP